MNFRRQLRSGDRNVRRWCCWCDCSLLIHGSRRRQQRKPRGSGNSPILMGEMMMMMVVVMMVRSRQWRVHRRPAGGRGVESRVRSRGRAGRDRGCGCGRNRKAVSAHHRRRCCCRRRGIVVIGVGVVVAAAKVTSHLHHCWVGGRHSEASSARGGRG